MKIDVITTKIYVFLLVAVSAAVLLTALFSGGGLALAADAERVFPADGYVQLSSCDLIAANGDYVAVCGTKDKIVSVSGKVNLQVSIEGLRVQGLYLFGDTLLLDCAEGRRHIRLDSLKPTLSETTLNGNVTYLTSSGNYLYAYTVGAVYRYDEDLTPNAIEDSFFNNLPVLVSDDTNLYMFSVEHGLNRFSTYNLTSKDYSRITTDLTVKAAAMGDVIYLYLETLNNDGNILAISKNYDPSAVGEGAQNSILFDTGLSSRTFSAYQDKLYVANGTDGYSIYELNADGNGVNLLSTHSMSGSTLDRLNTPADIAVVGNTKIVADKRNDRVLFVGSDVRAVRVQSPERLAVTADRVYASSGGTVSVITGGTTVIDTYQFDESVVDMACCGGRLFVLTSSGIYKLAAGGLELIAALSARALTVPIGGANLYALTDDGVRVFSTEGIEISILNRSISTNDQLIAVDIAVDYKGNVYVITSENKIITLDFVQFGTPSHRNEIPVQFEGKLTAVSAAFAEDGTLWLTAQEHMIAKINVGAINAENFVPITPFEPSGDVEIRLIADDCLAVSDLYRSESAYIFDEETAAVYTTPYQGFYYAVIGGQGLFLTSTSSPAIPQVIDADYTLNVDTMLYVYPDVQTKTVCTAGTRVRVIDDAAGLHSEKWYRASVNGQVYFIERTNLSVYTPNDTPQIEGNLYGRAKADRAGGTINAYLSPDDSSSVLFNLTDGTRVEVLETLDGYYKILHDGTVAYVKTDELRLEGLTTVQIIAIVLACLVVVAGTIVFAVTYFARKKLSEDN